MFPSNRKMYVCLKKIIIILFTVFLFQQKEVFSQTEEEQIRSTSDDNIVKVYIKLC